MDYRIETLLPGQTLADAFLVRQKVFTDEQGFDAAIDEDDRDPIAHHVVLYHGGEPVATGRTFPHGERPGVWVIGRVAVLPAHRGGTGRLLMNLLEQQAKGQGAGEITLGAQCQARGFYEKIGYEAYGDVFDEEGCPHIHMKKSL